MRVYVATISVEVRHTSQIAGAIEICISIFTAIFLQFQKKGKAQ